VVDGACLPFALRRAPGDRRRQARRLVAGEVRRAAVEEDLDRLARGEELEPPEERQPVDPPRAADAGEPLRELDADAVRGPVAEVRDDEEEQPAVEATSRITSGSRRSARIGASLRLRGSY
jgi:hypothetical protein